MTLTTFQHIPCITVLTKRQCTTISLPESYVVRDSSLAVTHQISKPLHTAYDYRRLYHSLPYLGLRPPVSCAFMRYG